MDYYQAPLKEKISFELPIQNTNRTVGTTLSGEVAKRHGLEGLPEETIRIRFQGSAGSQQIATELPYPVCSPGNPQLQFEHLLTALLKAGYPASSLQKSGHLET